MERDVWKFDCLHNPKCGLYMSRAADLCRSCCRYQVSPRTNMELYRRWQLSLLYLLCLIRSRTLRYGLRCFSKVDIGTLQPLRIFRSSAVSIILIPVTRPIHFLGSGKLGVKSRLVINALLEQFRFFGVPVFQGLNR